MSELTAVAETPVAGAAPGTESAAGQASSTPPAAENQTASATPSAQASPAESTPKYRFKSQQEAERAHSELQSKYSKLGDPEEAASMLQFIQQLRQDPKFREWAQSRLAEQETGSTDPETVKALQIVESVADRKARELMAPLVAQHQAVRLAAVTQAMDAKHPEWRDHAEAMREKLLQGIQAGMIPPQAIHNISLPFMENLYAMTIGLNPEIAAKRYEQKLKTKQAQATQATPGVAPAAVAAPSTKGLEGAFRAAMKQHGLA